MYRNICSPFQATGVFFRRLTLIFAGVRSFFIEKDINGWIGKSQTVNDSCQPYFCLNSRAYSAISPIFRQNQVKITSNWLINFTDECVQ
ncbi:hypothetical protein M5U04_14890 [Xenorhabdus sp. XENO-1]|uniref:hypothetical protein n=1 Tax=Xenorhabdus bovienii TaxID=40576 RepID=UPI0020CA623B|nr:hypothetical protein [Xenorhabdus bovienii]MCP9269342.1 hypothetical protein [Xenorhabdus bovienii subsp. africana]